MVLLGKNLDPSLVQIIDWSTHTQTAVWVTLFVHLYRVGTHSWPVPTAISSLISIYLFAICSCHCNDDTEKKSSMHTTPNNLQHATVACQTIECALNIKMFHLFTFCWTTKFQTKTMSRCNFLLHGAHSAMYLLSV